MKKKPIVEFRNIYGHANQFVVMEGNRMYLQSSSPTFWKIDVTCVYNLALDVMKFKKGSPNHNSNE